LRRYELEVIRQVETLKQQLVEKEKTIHLFNATDASRYL
jgi:hypothetical protein